MVGLHLRAVLSLSLSVPQANLKKFMEHVQQRNAEKVAKALEKGLDPNFHDPDTGGKGSDIGVGKLAGMMLDFCQQCSVSLSRSLFLSCSFFLSLLIFLPLSLFCTLSSLFLSPSCYCSLCLILYLIKHTKSSRSSVLHCKQRWLHLVGSGRQGKLPWRRLPHSIFN